MRHTYISIRIQEGPTSLVKEPFRIIIYSLHDLWPIETLNSFSISYITGTENKYNSTPCSYNKNSRLQKTVMLHQWHSPCSDLLKPSLHLIQVLHWYRRDHCNLSLIVFEHEYHVKVFQLKLRREREAMSRHSSPFSERAL